MKTLTTADIDGVLATLQYSSEELRSFRRVQPALASAIDDIAAAAKEGNTSPDGWAMLIGHLVYKCAEEANATDTA